MISHIMQEVLRFYATIPFTERMASADATIPLADAVPASNGTLVKEVRVKKGQTVVISIMDYNRCVYIIANTNVSGIKLGVYIDCRVSGEMMRSNSTLPDG